MTFRVDVTGTAPGLNHSHFTALQVKNALVDRATGSLGRAFLDRSRRPRSLPAPAPRPRGSGAEPDGSGGSLHRRGYRAAMGAAPLKENLAAGLIRLTGWDGHQPLVDPCCGPAFC